MKSVFLFGLTPIVYVSIHLHHPHKLKLSKALIDSFHKYKASYSVFRIILTSTIGEPSFITSSRPSIQKPHFS